MEQTINTLNQILADEHILLMRTRNYHWNVSGVNFKPLHELFEEQYNSTFEIIDEVAERIKTIGGTPLYTLKSLLEKTNLEEHQEIGDQKAMIQQLESDHRHISETITKTLGTTDAGTESFLGGVLEQHEKMSWMLRASL